MKKNNFPTLIAIAILSWMLVNMFHEIVGHAGFGLLLGLKLKAVNTTTAYFDVNWENEIAKNGFWGLRLFCLGGVLINFLTGLMAYLVLKYKKPLNSQMRFFLWLFASCSFVIVVMNLVIVPFTGGGDLAAIIRTYDTQGHAKNIALIIGLIIMISGYILLQKSFMPKIKGHRLILLSFTAIPVVSIIIIQTLSLLKSPFAYLPPSQNHLLASVFAYFHFLLWAIIVNIIPCSGKTNSIEEVLINRSTVWITIGVIISIFYILILGPGIGSFIGHPSL